MRCQAKITKQICLHGAYLDIAAHLGPFSSPLASFCLYGLVSHVRSHVQPGTVPASSSIYDFRVSSDFSSRSPPPLSSPSLADPPQPTGEPWCPPSSPVLGPWMLLHEIALVVIIFYEALNCDGEMRPLYLPLTFSPAGAPAPAPAAAIPQVCPTITSARCKFSL